MVNEFITESLNSTTALPFEMPQFVLIIHQYKQDENFNVFVEGARPRRSSIQTVRATRR